MDISLPPEGVTDFRIGRRSKSHFIADSPTISWTHVILSIIPESGWCVDVSDVSSNGTFVLLPGGIMWARLPKKQKTLLGKRVSLRLGPSGSVVLQIIVSSVSSQGIVLSSGSSQAVGRSNPNSFVIESTRAFGHFLFECKHVNRKIASSHLYILFKEHAWTNIWLARIHALLDDSLLPSSNINLEIVLAAALISLKYGECKFWTDSVRQTDGILPDIPVQYLILDCLAQYFFRQLTAHDATVWEGLRSIVWANVLSTERQMINGSAFRVRIEPEFSPEDVLCGSSDSQKLSIEDMLPKQGSPTSIVASPPTQSGSIASMYEVLVYPSQMPRDIPLQLEHAFVANAVMGHLDVPDAAFVADHYERWLAYKPTFAIGRKWHYANVVSGLVRAASSVYGAEWFKHCFIYLEGIAATPGLRHFHQTHPPRLCVAPVCTDTHWASLLLPLTEECAYDCLLCDGLPSASMRQNAERISTKLRSYLGSGIDVALLRGEKTPEQVGRWECGPLLVYRTLKTMQESLKPRFAKLRLHSEPTLGVILAELSHLHAYSSDAVVERTSGVGVVASSEVKNGDAGVHGVETKISDVVWIEEDSFFEEQIGKAGRAELVTGVCVVPSFSGFPGVPGVDSVISAAPSGESSVAVLRMCPGGANVPPSEIDASLVDDCHGARHMAITSGGDSADEITQPAPVHAKDPGVLGLTIAVSQNTTIIGVDGVGEQVSVPSADGEEGDMHRRKANFEVNTHPASENHNAKGGASSTCGSTSGVEVVASLEVKSGDAGVHGVETKISDMALGAKDSLFEQMGNAGSAELVTGVCEVPGVRGVPGVPCVDSVTGDAPSGVSSDAVFRVCLDVANVPPSEVDAGIGNGAGNMAITSGNDSADETIEPAPDDPIDPDVPGVSIVVSPNTTFVGVDGAGEQESVPSADEEEGDMHPRKENFENTSHPASKNRSAESGSSSGPTSGVDVVTSAEDESGDVHVHVVETKISDLANGTPSEVECHGARSTISPVPLRIQAHELALLLRKPLRPVAEEVVENGFYQGRKKVTIRLRSKSSDLLGSSGVLRFTCTSTVKFLGLVAGDQVDVAYSGITHYESFKHVCASIGDEVLPSYTSFKGRFHDFSGDLGALRLHQLYPYAAPKPWPADKLYTTVIAFKLNPETCEHAAHLAKPSTNEIRHDSAEIAPPPKAKKAKHESGSPILKRARAGPVAESIPSDSPPPKRSRHQNGVSGEPLNDLATPGI